MLRKAILTIASCCPSWFDDLWITDATPVPCGMSREAVKRSDLAGRASYGYCVSRSRWYWGLKLYRNLALALASALLTIVDAGSYIPLVDAILNAMPDSWYALSTHTNGHFTGARANGWMDLTPYWVQPL